MAVLDQKEVDRHQHQRHSSEQAAPPTKPEPREEYASKQREHARHAAPKQVVPCEHARNVMRIRHRKVHHDALEGEEDAGQVE